MGVLRALPRVVIVLMMSCAAFAVSGASPSVAATTSLGQLGGAPSACQANLDAVQLSVSSGTPYTVPAGSWLVTSWSTRAGDGPAPSGSLQLEMWRPTAIPDQYMLVGISPVATTSASGTNTFELTSPIAVQGGDLLGLRNLTQDYGCAHVGGPGLTSPGASPIAPVPGEVRTLPPLQLQVTLNIAATLVNGPELQVRKTVSGAAPNGFTAQVHCTAPAVAAVDTELAFQADGTPDTTSTPSGWNTRAGAWVLDDPALTGSTCTVTETDSAGATSVSYACSWTAGTTDGAVGAGCPGASSGPTATPTSVTFESDGDGGILTIANTFPAPPPVTPPITPPITIAPKFTG